ncbi:MAG: flippase [Candidatus Altimarinota bacterium]
MSARRILSNTAIQVFGKLVTAVLSIIVIKYITGLETIPGLEGIPADYKLIYTYLTFFGIVADFGLFTIAVRELSQTEDEQEKEFIMGNIFGMRFFTILMAMTLASLFVFLIPLENYTWNVKVGVAIAAITTVLTMLASTTSSILQVHLKMELPTIALVIGKIIMTAYIVYVVIFFQEITYAFYHLIFAGIAGSLVTFLITYHYTKKFFPFTPKFHPEYWKKVFKEALPYGIAIILSTLYFKIDVLLLSFFRDKNEIALYGYPSSIIELLAIFPIYFMNSTLPTLTRAFEESKEKAKKIINLSFNFLALMALPMTLGGVILARPLMGFIMNEEFLTGNVVGFYGADLAFQLLIVSTLFAFFTTLFSFTLIASGHQAKLLKINFYGVMFNIITNLLFIPLYGFVAAGITTILSEILIVYLTYKTAGKFVQLHFDKKTFLKILAATIIMGAFVYLVRQNVSVFPLVGMGAAVFIASLIPLRVLTPEVLDMVKKK